jgi:hypothetical protein
LSLNKKLDKVEAPSSRGLFPPPVERKQVEERVGVGVNLVYAAIRREAETTLNRPLATLTWSASIAKATGNTIGGVSGCARWGHPQVVGGKDQARM